jgi:phage terminase small subunit
MPKLNTLNRRQQLFCQYIAEGESQARAYLKAGFKANTIQQAGSNAIRLIRTERVASYLSKLKELNFAKNALSVSEKRAFLARAVRTPVGEITEASDLAQEVTFSEGKEGSSRKVRAVDKLKAIELDSKISGDFYADRNENINNPFLFLVSLGKQSVDVLQHGEVIQGEVRSGILALPESAPTTIRVDAELVE